MSIDMDQLEEIRSRHQCQKDGAPMGNKNAAGPHNMSGNAGTGNSSVEPYTGKRSGDAALDKQFDLTRKKKSALGKAKESADAAYKKACAKLGITKDINSPKNQKAVRKARDPEYTAAYNKMIKAGEEHVKAAKKLKTMYQSWRRSTGGPRIPDYFAAASDNESGY